MATARDEHLKRLAQRVADALPAELVEEVVLTGSVSRGMADEASDIEMLVVTRESLDLEDCFRLARAAGLSELGTWGAQDGPARRVSGYLERVPVELIWWVGNYAEEQIDALLAGAMPSTADALAHGIALRTSGRLAAWQERLRAYPPGLATARIEEAALPWGGFAPAGLLTLIRPGDRLALAEWTVDSAIRILTIVFALNRVWQPTTKRIAVRVAPLQIKPDRLVERLEDALTESDPQRALCVLTELQLDTVLIAPSGPNVDRARTWLAAGVSILRSGESRD
jgi:predicted nucleotidyltransferase